MARLKDIQRDRLILMFENLRMKCSNEQEFYAVLAHTLTKEIDNIHDYYHENYKLNDRIISKNTKF